MKKKLLVTMLSVSMVAAMLGGCGKTEKVPTEPTKEITQEVTDETVSDDEVIEEAVEDQTKVYTAEDIKNAIDPENLGFVVEQDGIKITLMSSGEDMMMGYGYTVPASLFESDSVDLESSDTDFDLDKIKADGSYEMSVDFYKVDGVVYCRSNTTGKDVFMKCTDDGADSMFSTNADMTTTGVDTDKIEKVEYINTMEFDGKTVDVVEITEAAEDTTDETAEVDEVDVEDTEVTEDATTASTVLMYIDVETGKAVAMSSEQDGKEVIIRLTNGTINLPAEFDDAIEVTSDEVGMQVFTLFMMPMAVEQMTTVEDGTANDDMMVDPADETVKE